MNNNQIIQNLINDERIPSYVNKSALLSEELRPFPNLPITQSFYMQGGNGVGKTYFATLFLRDWLINQLPDGFQNYQYKDLPDFVKMDKLEQYIREKNGFDEDRRYGAKLILNEIKESKLFILDDFWVSQGTPNFKQLMLSELFDILDYRVTNKLQTVITTNLDLSKIDLIDNNYGRIVSRIRSFPELELPNKKDLRFAGKIETEAVVKTIPDKLTFDF